MESLTREKEDIAGHKLSDIRTELKEFTNMKTNERYTRNAYSCYDADLGEKVQFIGNEFLDDQFENRRINFNAILTIGQYISRLTGLVNWEFEEWEFASQKPPKGKGGKA